VLSENAERLLADLRYTPATSLCPDCAARDLALTKWDVLKLIRELIGDGRVLCSYAFCLSYRRPTLVVEVRRKAWPPLDEPLARC